MQESAPLAGNTHLYSFVKFFFFQMESGIRTFSVHQLIGSPWLEANVCCWCSPGRCSRDHRGRQGSKDPRLRDPAPVHRQTVRSDKTPHHGRNHRDIAHQSEIPSLLLMSDFRSAKKKGETGQRSVTWPCIILFCGFNTMGHSSWATQGQSPQWNMKYPLLFNQGRHPVQARGHGTKCRTETWTLFRPSMLAAEVCKHTVRFHCSITRLPQQNAQFWEFLSLEMVKKNF